MSEFNWVEPPYKQLLFDPLERKRARSFDSSRLSFQTTDSSYRWRFSYLDHSYHFVPEASFSLSFPDMSSSVASSSSSSSLSKRKGKSKAKRPVRSRQRPANTTIVTANKTRFSAGKTKALNPYYRKVATQMIAPGSCGSKPVLLPSNGASQMCSRHIHKEFDVSADDYPNGFSILIEPDFSTPSYLSALDVVAVPSLGAGKLTVSGSCSQDGIVQSIGQWKAKSGSAESAVIQNTVATVEGDDWMILDVAAAAGSGGRLHVQDRSPNQCVYTLIIATQAGASPLEPLASVTTSQSESTETDLGLLPACDRILWRLVDAGQPSILEMNFHFSEAQISSDAASALVPAFSRFATEFGVSAGRIGSIGCLVTNTSPAIQKGGNINSARIPRNFRIFDDPVSNIASLPDNRRYQSTAETGTYVFWIPEQLDEFEVDDLANKYRQYKNSNRLLVVCTGYPAGATFKVHIDWVIEFYTANQLFEKAVNPHMTPEMVELFRVIASMPAAMCNPEHENATQKTLESWKKYGSDALDTVKSGVEFVEKYGPLLYQIAEVLAALV